MHHFRECISNAPCLCTVLKCVWNYNVLDTHTFTCSFVHSFEVLLLLLVWNCCALLSIYSVNSSRHLLAYGCCDGLKHQFSFHSMLFCVFSQIQLSVYTICCSLTIILTIYSSWRPVLYAIYHVQMSRVCNFQCRDRKKKEREARTTSWIQENEYHVHTV